MYTCQWTVVKTPVEITEQQLEEFRQLMTKEGTPLGRTHLTLGHHHNSELQWTTSGPLRVSTPGKSCMQRQPRPGGAQPTIPQSERPPPASKCPSASCSASPQSTPASHGPECGGSVRENALSRL